MTKKLTGFAAIMLAAALTACGGGGGGSDPATPPASGGGNTSGGSGSNVSTPITVTSAAAPTVTTADCPRLLSEQQSIAALDLSNPNIKAVNDFLTQVDPDHAYKVFVRRPYDFVNWIVMDATGSATPGQTGTLTFETVGTAAHETLHGDDNALAVCPTAGYRILFFGSIMDTGLRIGDTANIKLLDAVIDPALKSARRYGIYITDAASGNDFTVLLDEFAAYVGEAHTEFRMLSAGKPAGTSGLHDAGLGGTVNFMVYLENYLKAARLNDAATYGKITGNQATIAAIQTLWNAAEQVLRDSAPYAKADSVPQLIVDSAYLSAAYSADLLSELDAVGVTHASKSAWSGSYLP